VTIVPAGIHLMAHLSAQAVFKTYRLGRVDVPVLRGASIDVDKGEWVAILGASGSGKSTLLHILGGLDRPDRADRQVRAENGSPRRGRVVFEGRVLSDLSARDLDRYRCESVGFVFQFYHLLPELTVLENVTIGAMVRRGIAGYHGAAPQARARASDLLDAFGLSPRLRHRPAELSGGERQRVAIARALMNDPPVLLADEPTGNLDRKTGASILDALESHRKATGRTMVIVTHDPDVARRASRVVRLDDGRVVNA
jgi:lipoprotein-releasing system ATP-binding protein